MAFKVVVLLVALLLVLILTLLLNPYGAAVPLGALILNLNADIFLSVRVNLDSLFEMLCKSIFSISFSCFSLPSNDLISSSEK